MILNQSTLKSLKGVKFNTEDKFFIDGKDFNDCYNQLLEFGKNNPKKWIYYHDCGSGVSYPVPLCRHNFEVHIYDKEPSGIIMLRLFQKGSDNLREIDFMSEEEKAILKKKMLMTGYMLLCSK